MNWEDGKLFLAVARSGQMLAAAKTVGLNQATLSRRILALEQAMHTQLLNRRPHGCDLTDEGRVLAYRLEKIESEFLAAEGELDGRDVGVSGTIRIGAPDGFGTAFLAPRLPAFLSQHPNLSIQLVPVPRSFSLSQREADVAVTVGRPTRGNLVVRKLAEYRLSLYAAEGYIAKNGMPKSIEDLADHQLVSYVEDLIYTPALDYAREISRKWSGRIEVASALGQQEVVLAGGGIGILHDYLVTQKNLKRILPKVGVNREYWVAYHETLRGIPRIRAVLDFLNDQARSIEIEQNE